MPAPSRVVPLVLAAVLAVVLAGGVVDPAPGAAPAPAETVAHQQDPQHPHQHRHQHGHQHRTAKAVLARMSLPQRVGQLFMVGTPAVKADPATRRQIRRFHVGSVMLTGRSYHGPRRPARVSRTMQAQVSAAATERVRLFVATDQEGGAVRVLQGPGFSDIPAALVQGRWLPRRLRGAAEVWARQLRRAGVNLNLAPVMDTVPGKRAARHNPPIGRYDREFGYTTRVVAHHGVAFLRGMTDGGVVPAVKHFPGLGRVRENTDTRGGVTDHVTTRRDQYLHPFRAAVGAGVPVVMVSTAYYERLDPERPAAFSPFVIGTMLRRDLGFGGVVVSDDLGRARQVAGFTPAGRALRFIGAGGDLLLTVDPRPLPAMYRAVLGRARTSDRFRALVDAAALRVLQAKERRHLL